ncbi:hypothetical protein HDU93_005056 [Gonapodya sp. JEL0774]|nr:hypothetical protein HDU93_005056 [Gonapodya sp. JEL0774]
MRQDAEARGRSEAEKTFSATRASLLRDLHHTQSLLQHLEQSHTLALAQLRREHDARTSALRAQLAAESDMRNQEASTAATRITELEVRCERLEAAVDEAGKEMERRCTEAEGRARRAEEELFRARETVKVECEERAGLIGTIEKLRGRLAAAPVGFIPPGSNRDGAWSTGARGSSRPPSSAAPTALRPTASSTSASPTPRPAEGRDTTLSPGSRGNSPFITRNSSSGPDAESESIEASFERMAAAAMMASRGRALKRGRGR